MEKIFQIFQDLRFDISFADALLLMPRFAPTIKSLLMNKEKLLELAKIPDDIEFLLHHDPSTLLKSVASILKGFINAPPFKENDDLFDLECKTN
ncbi:hypothetical protein Tco_1346954 [Tanacetum coccineum]